MALQTENQRHDVPASVHMDRGTATASQVVAAPVADVWRALTDPDAVAQWWAPGNIHPTVGHAFSLDMGPWGAQPCEVTVVEVNHRFSYLFAIGMLDSEVHWTLTPEGDGTRVDLVHDGFNLSTAVGRRGYEGMGAGWPSVLARLAAMVASPAVARR